MKLVFVLSLLALYVGATPTGIAKKPKGRIFNGIVAAEGQFPYQIFFRVNSAADPHQCSGAILSKDWVVTPSYCIFPEPKIVIQAGSIFVSTYDPNRVTVEVAEIYDYINPKSENTIGLFKLETPLTFNEYIQPIRIWKEPIEEDTVLTVSGWGAIRYNGASTNYLQYTSIRVISENECQKANPYFYDEYRMCANTTSSRFRHLCAGDVGNLLVLYGGPEPLLVGVAIDYGDNCGRENYASGFIKIHKYVDWIQNVTGLNF